MEDFNDLKNHFFHSIPPDGIIVQYGHSDYEKTSYFLKTNELDITLAAISDEEVAPKLEAFFLILAKWSSRVEYLPIHSVLASFIGYTPVDLFHKKGSVYQPAIQKKSFMPETESNEDGFLYLTKDDLLVY